MLRIGIILFLVIIIQSCERNTLDSKSDKKSLSNFKILTAETFDSLSIVIRKNDDVYAFKALNDILQNSRNIQDSLTLAKAYQFISYRHLISNELDKANVNADKAKQICLRLGFWEELMSGAALQSRIYRRQGKIDLIENLLKYNIDQIKRANINSYAELHPIHELAVHYSYDLQQYKKAIYYGELFYERLNYFDSLKTDNPNFIPIKEYKVDVIDLILGASYIKMGQLEKSYQHLNKAFINYTKRKDIEKLNRVHKTFIEYYIQTGNIEKLIYHKEEFYRTTLKLMDKSSKNEKDIHLLKVKLMEDESELFVLKEENKLKSLMIYASILTMSIVLMFQWYSSKLRRVKREVNSELEILTEFNKFKTNLLITIAHEIRTPLTIILGDLQLISDENIQLQSFKMHFEKIKSTSQGILNKMADIIHLVKDDKTIAPVVLQEINIQPFLKNLFFQFEGVAQIKQIQLVFSSKLPANYILKTDPKILSSLLSNLFHNAIKFSHSKSKVKMHVGFYDKKLTIEVADKGVGIPEADQEIIFDKFKRMPESVHIDGFGIGLAIVKQLTTQLNGQINVQSSIGKGSTFTVTLPNERDVLYVNEKSELTHTTAVDQGIKTPYTFDKILIVEDNPQMCNFYNDIFSPLFDCTFAFNGLEGFNLLKTTPFDLIISDVMMPEMNGFEFKDKVRAMPNREHIPFIMVTAKDQDENKIKAFNIGVDDYIVKPFNKEELIARIKAQIENKKSRDAWSMLNEEEINTVGNNFDVKTVQKLHKIVLNNCANENFSVLDLAIEIGLSQRQLVRVTKKLTGLTPVKFILEIRLLEAYKKIKNKSEADMNNIRFSVGILSASYFSTQFKKRFGLNPTELAKFKKSKLINLEKDIASF